MTDSSRSSHMSSDEAASEDISERIHVPYGIPDMQMAHAIAKRLRSDDTIETPFQSRIERYITIDDTCREYLRSLQREPQVFEAGANIYRVRSDMRGIHILQSGWVIGYTLTSGGARHIYRVYQPGDMIGIEDMNWSYHSATVTAVTPAVVAMFPKHELRDVFEESPRLARTIFSMSMMDQVQGFDEMRSVGRLDAEARVAALILRLNARAKAAGLLLDDPLQMAIPLTQGQIGDAVGLTNVSVSRALTSLTQRGLIARGGHHLRILDRDTLAELGDFTDRYTHVDTVWVGTPANSTCEEA